MHRAKSKFKHLIGWGRRHQSVEIPTLVPHFAEFFAKMITLRIVQIYNRIGGNTNLTEIHGDQTQWVVWGLNTKVLCIKLEGFLWPTSTSGLPPQCAGFVVHELLTTGWRGADAAGQLRRNLAPEVLSEVHDVETKGSWHLRFLV